MTDYDGASKPFTIGLKPLDLADWIDSDENLRAYLDEKDRLAARVPHDIFAALPGSEAAQAEVLSLLAEHLPRRYPDIYQHFGTHIDIIPAFRRVRLDDPFLPPLLVASNLVQEDLAILQRDDDWRLTAAALSFPSSWRLRDKIGKPMHDVHAPVPGFGPDTRNAERIARIFDNLRPEQPVVRWNVSFYGEAALHHPEPSPPERFKDGVFLRLERQTLRKPPDSGAILFTIRISVEPIETVAARPEGTDMLRELAAQIAALDDAQLAYKGLTWDRDQLISRLTKP